MPESCKRFIPPTSRKKSEKVSLQTEFVCSVISEIGSQLSWMKARVLIIATLDLPTSASSNLLLRLWRVLNYDSVAIVNERYTKALVELFREALSRPGKHPLGNKVIENNEI